MTTNWRWWVLACGLAAGLVAVSVLLGGHQRHTLTFGSLDEQAHYDYVVDLSHSHLPAVGDRYSQPTLRLISCIGVSYHERHGCGIARRNPRLYTPLGYSYEAHQPPLVYLSYLLVARPNVPPRQAIAAVRRGGTIWAVVAAGLLVTVGSVEGLSILELTALLSICLVSPIAVSAAATVTNDSAGVAAGALVVLTWALSRRKRRPMAMFGLVVGIALGLMKGLFVVAPFVLLVAGLVSDPRVPRRAGWGEWWRRHGNSLCMVLGAAVSYGGWIVVQELRAVAPPSVVVHALLGFSTTALPQWSTIFSSLEQQLLLLIGSSPLYFIWDLAIFGTLAGTVMLPGPDDHRTLRATAIAVFVGLASLAIGWVLLFYFAGHYNSPSDARFGLPVLPIIALVVVRATRKSGVVILGVAIPGAAAIAQLGAGRF